MDFERGVIIAVGAVQEGLPTLTVDKICLENQPRSRSWSWDQGTPPEDVPLSTSKLSTRKKRRRHCCELHADVLIKGDFILGSNNRKPSS